MHRLSGIEISRIQSEKGCVKSLVALAGQPLEVSAQRPVGGPREPFLFVLLSDRTVRLERAPQSVQP